MDEDQISEMYKRLPQSSKGVNADNPKRFLSFWEGKFVGGADIWPYLLLCKDRKNGNLTWHMLCDEASMGSLSDEKERKECWEPRIASMRNRPLEIIEIYSRCGDKYIL